MKRLSSLTDLLDLSSKYRIAFFTMWALLCFPCFEAPVDDPSPVDSAPGAEEDAAPSEDFAGGLSVWKDPIRTFACQDSNIIRVK